MILKCPNCHKQYNIDESKIPSGAKQAKCKACGKNIPLRLDSPIPVKLCPKCGHPSGGKQQDECPACGIIYAKFSSDKVRKPKPPPASNIVPDQEQSAPPVKDMPERRKITIPAWVIPAIIGLVVGYFAGREHVKYELRQTFKSATEGITKSFGSTFGEIGSDKKEKLPPSKPKEPDPFSVILNSKEFQEANFRAGIQDAIVFSLTFENLTGKDIRAFDGKLIFTDLLDNEILSVGLAVNDSVFSGSQLEWFGQIDYNQFIGSDRKLRGEDSRNLKIQFYAKKILFSDGSVKEFE